MKYRYEFSEMTFENGAKNLIIMMEEEYQMMARFLNSDVQIPDPEYIYEAVDKVLSGESECETLNGNVCEVEIHKDFTQIYDSLAPDGMGYWCELETEEFRELVGIWCKELGKFRG